MGLWKEGLGAMFKRYKEIWKAVWNIREQLDPPKREEDERAFLPAQLELVETPLSNAPKWAARLIMLFFVITLLWAILGHMEVVATAQGKTVLSGRSKAIKSLEDGGIIKIYVKNGDIVKAGDPLVTLDFLKMQNIAPPMPKWKSSHKTSSSSKKSYRTMKSSAIIRVKVSLNINITKRDKIISMLNMNWPHKRAD